MDCAGAFTFAGCSIGSLGPCLEPFSSEESVGSFGALGLTGSTLGCGASTVPPFASIVGAGSDSGVCVPFCLLGSSSGSKGTTGLTVGGSEVLPVLPLSSLGTVRFGGIWVGVAVRGGAGLGPADCVGDSGAVAADADVPLVPSCALLEGSCPVPE